MTSSLSLKAGASTTSMFLAPPWGRRFALAFGTCEVQGSNGLRRKITLAECHVGTTPSRREDGASPKGWRYVYSLPALTVCSLSGVAVDTSQNRLELLITVSAFIPNLKDGDFPPTKLNRCLQPYTTRKLELQNHNPNT